MSGQPKNLATATVELVRETSRRLSADLRDMGREFGREFRDMGREIRDMHREIGNRIRSSSLHTLPKIEISKIGLASLNPDTRCNNMEYIQPGQDLDNLLDDEDDVSVWTSTPHLCCDDDNDYIGSISSQNRLSASIIRSPRTEEILKNVEEALRKTDRTFRDMLGIEVKNTSGMSTPKFYHRELKERISAPPPSPSNFGLSTFSK